MPYMAGLRLVKRALTPTGIQYMELKGKQATLEVSGVSLGAWM
jgi:hypothetical protein